MRETLLEKEDFNGIWVPTITPIGENEEILKTTIIKHYHYLSKSKINGIIPLSPIGECASLTFEEKHMILEITKEESGKMKIMPQIGDNSLGNVLQLASIAESSGADAVCIIPPNFYPISPTGMYNFLSKIIKSVSFPVFVYNMETYAKVPMHMELIERLKEFPNFYGIIDGGKDIDYINMVKSQFPNLLLFSGRDRYHHQWLQLGSDGIVSWMANTYPWVFCYLLELHQKGLESEALSLQQKIAGLRDIIRKYPFPASLKYTLYQLGFPAMKVRFPLDNLLEEHRTHLKTDLAKYINQSKLLKIPGQNLGEI